MYDISYANIMLYSSVIPSYNSEKTKGKEDEVINGDDPANAEKIERELYG